MGKQEFNVYSTHSLRRAHDFIDDIAEENSSFKITITTGKKASMPQLALFNIWVRQYCAHLLRKPEKSLSKGELAGMKRAVKRRYYHETHEPFMVERITDPFHPDKSRLEVTSAADWTQGEMYRVMEWLQNTAGEEHGIILESVGEHARLKQQTGA